MEEIRSVHLKRLHGQLGEVVYELTRIQFSQLHSGRAWTPAINVYRCPGEQFIICMDLAGVDQSALQLRVEHDRLVIRGRREPPEPSCNDERPLQVLAMEIDYGPFERLIKLPSEVDHQRVRAEQQNGMLWIRLPVHAQS